MDGIDVVQQAKLLVDDSIPRTIPLDRHTQQAGIYQCMVVLIIAENFTEYVVGELCRAFMNRQTGLYAHAQSNEYAAKKDILPEEPLASPHCAEILAHTAGHNHQMAFPSQ